MTRPLSPRLALALLATLALAIASSPGKAQPPLALEGTWFVLIHYQDPGSANPEAFRWSDKVWDFARKGTDYNEFWELCENELAADGHTNDGVYDWDLLAAADASDEVLSL